MKKITFIIAMLAIAFASANAEDFGRGYGRGGRGSSSDHPLTIGVGYNMLHEYASGNGVTLSSNMHGLYLGGAYAAELSGNLFVEPGINILINLDSETDDSWGVITTKSSTMIDLAIPINFGYRLDLGGAQLAFFAGPVVNFGIIASSKSTSMGVSTSSSAYDENGGRNRFDLMVDAGARLTFGQFGINISYALGLFNRYGDLMGDGGMIKDNRLTAGVTYSF